MLSYIVRRLLLMIPTLIGITLLVFLVMAMAPGGLTASLRSAEGDMRPEQREVIRAYYNKRYGLDLPWYRQYLRWLNQVLPVGFKQPRIVISYEQLQSRFEQLQATGMTPEQASAAIKEQQLLAIQLDLSTANRLQSVTVTAPQSQYDKLIGIKPTQFTVSPQQPTAVVQQGQGFPAALPFGLKAPDLGESFLRKRRVIDVVAEALPITLLLNLVTIPIIYAISITTGIFAAKHRGRSFDVGTGTLFLALWSVPVMWAGVMLLGYFASRQFLPWFPASGLHDPLAPTMSFLPNFADGTFHRGWLLDTLWHLVLPVACLTYGGFAFLSKLMRASVLENLSADFARTARAKGLAENLVLMRHVLANSLLPLITVAAAILPSLLGGSLIVEKIFSINGMGVLMLEAIYQKDRELVMSVTFVISIVSLLSLIIADILYAVADPRVSYE